MRRGLYRWLWTVAVVMWCATTATGDEVAQPWGTFHADIGGRSASDHPSLIFDSAAWANGAEVAWSIDLATAGIDRPPYWSSIVFDEEGNLYWKSLEPRIISAAPDGTIRWTANIDTNGAPVNHFLGSVSTDSPVVGDGGPSGRVYTLGDEGLDNSGFAVAYSKADGSVQWITLLPGSRFGPSDVGVRRLTPVLYNGKLYVLGAYQFDFFNQWVRVFQIDSATGLLDWSADIPAVGSGVMVNYRGQMTLVPDAFGSGKHGLYFNGSSGNGADSKSEMYAVKIDTAGNTASLEWSSEGGHVTRSHVIHLPDSNRVCTATWTDFGAEFYCWDLFGSNGVAYNNVPNSGHGFYDITCLDFDGNDVIAGGFDGRIIRYRDIDVTTNGPASDVYYQMDEWWGEPRVIGGLYLDANSNSILISGTNSRSDCVNRPPGSIGECLGETGYEARVFAVDLTNGNELPNCASIEDGAAFIDNFTITGGPDEGNQTTILDVAGFESYALGDVPTNGTNPGGTAPPGFTWDLSPWMSSNGPAQIVEVTPEISTTGVGTRVMWLDAFAGCGDFQGAFANLGGATTDNVVIVSWDQYRQDVWDNIWMAEHTDFRAWWAMQWDIAEAISPRRFDEWEPALVGGEWQHVEYKFDFVFSEVTVTVEDVSTNTFLDPFGDPDPETSLRGWLWEIEGTEYSQGPAARTYPLFSYNTGSIQDHAFTVRGGPLLGPTTGARNTEQHIYYFRPANPDFGITAQLVALRAVTEFRDCNTNGVQDAIDIATGFSDDCNGNNIPDECDVAAGTSEDTNSNGVPDECEDLSPPEVTAAVSIKAHGMASGGSLFVEMDQQINIGTNGDAITALGGGTLSFLDGGDGWTRMSLDGGGWYFGPQVDFVLAGLGTIPIEGGGTLAFDARYFNDPTTNTDPYADAPIFVRVYSENGGFRNYGIVYATQDPWNDPPHPTWTHVTIDVVNDVWVEEPGTEDFDPRNVARVLFYGTDWFGSGDDFVDIKNLSMNTNPYPNRLGIDVLAGTESRTSGPTEVVVTFDEDVFGVGVLDVTDVTVDSGTVNNVSTNGQLLTIEMSGVPDDTVLTIGFPGIMDALGNTGPDPLTFGVLLSDADGDMDVDLGDFAVFQQCFTVTAPIGAECASSDFVTDGDLDLANDYAAFSPAMTGPGP